MLVPFVLLCLLVIPGDPRARAAAAPGAEVEPVGHPEVLLLSGKYVSYHVRKCGPRWVSGTGAGRPWHRILKNVQLVPKAAIEAVGGLAVAPAKEGLRADASDGTGEVGGAAVSQGVVLRQVAAQPAGHKVHRRGGSSLISHPGPRGEGGLREKPASTAWRSRTGTQCHWVAFIPTTALDENWTSNLKW